MYEHMSPWHNQLGLYDGLAHVIGTYLIQVNQLGLALNENVVQLQMVLIQDMCSVLRADNKAFNEARFRQRMYDLEHEIAPK